MINYSGIQLKRQTDIQRDRHTDRQANVHRNRHTDIPDESSAVNAVSAREWLGLIMA